MLSVITSNRPVLKTIHRGGDNYILVHTSEVMRPPRMDAIYHFDVYFQEGQLDPEEEFESYLDSPTLELEFHHTPSIPTALDDIAEELVDWKGVAHDEAIQSNDTEEEIMVACACAYQWNGAAVKYLLGQLRSYHCDLEPLNLFRVLRMPGDDRLADFVRTSLNSKMVYPEDPIQYGYAIHRMIRDHGR